MERIQRIIGSLIEKEGLRGTGRLLGVNPSTISSWVNSGQCSSTVKWQHGQSLAANGFEGCL